MVEPLFAPSQSMAEAVAAKLGDVRIIDVGASEYAGGSPPPYQMLCKLAGSTVIAFDPELDGEEQRSDSRRLILPYAIGDGREHIFHLCAAPMTSSLLEPNTEWLSQFEGLAELCRVVDRHPMQTSRLDDVVEARGAEFLKIDVQGATLLVLENAVNVLDDILLLHTEVEFGPIYKGQPLFGDVSRFLAEHGFEFHHFRDFGAARDLAIDRSFAFGTKASRHIWSDALFVPSTARMEQLNDRQLLLLAAMLHDCYGVEDMAHACLTRIDQRNGGELAHAYRLALLMKTNAAAGLESMS